MGRLHIHAGFHKTGTTSLQSFLKGNRRRLAPQVQFYLKPNFQDLCKATRQFSQLRTNDALSVVSDAAQSFWRTLDPNEATDLILSSEDLAGHLPGRNGVKDYSAAPVIMKTLAKTHANSHLSAWELSFHFTTRETQSWATSCYAQHVRITRLSEKLEAYLRRPEAQCDLMKTVSSIQRSIAPIAVRSQRLEDLLDMPFGPAEILLDAIQLDAATKQKLRAPLKENASPSAKKLEEMRQINASDVDNSTAAKLKQDIRLPLPEKTGP